MYPNLIAELNRYNMTYKDLADCLKIGLTAVNDRMSGKTDWKIKELKKLKKEKFSNCSLEYLSVTKEEFESEKEIEI